MGGGMQRVWDSAPFTVDYQHGPGDQLVIAFSSVGHDPARPPSAEFVRSLSGGRALFVRDAARSWANDPGFEAAVLGAYRAACEAGPVARVMTLGLSMGAFAALVAAQVLPVDVVLGFGPQYSVAPGSGETRWATWTDRLTAPQVEVAEAASDAAVIAELEEAGIVEPEAVARVVIAGAYGIFRKARPGEDIGPAIRMLVTRVVGK